VRKRRGDSDFYDPRTGDEAMRLTTQHFTGTSYDPARTNYFSIYWIKSGKGKVARDTSWHDFGPQSLLFLVPYQHLRFLPEESVEVEVIQFHANFLCVETFHADVGCSGTLFNDPYGTPLLSLDRQAEAEISALVKSIHREQASRSLAYGEASLAYLKVLLILATRQKNSLGNDACHPGLHAHRHPILTELSQLIEQQYSSWHSPAQYAEALHTSAKTLGRIVRESLGTTLTDLIRSRLLIHAKWQLLHTLRPVKEIAQEVGFSDELYFSRFFKKGTGISPTYFRDFETAIRGGSNLSISSGQSSIPTPTPSVDNSTMRGARADRIAVKQAPKKRRSVGHERSKSL
jgi:AraC family transcriptional activator of pobA